MPKRTNDFQDVVAAIHRAMASKGAQVTESALLTENGTESLREIDVLIEYPTEPYRVKIAVEAKAHRRKLSVTEIETLVGKYRGPHSVLVDRVVIVSQSGYSRAAREKALANGFELLSLHAAKDVDWFGKFRAPAEQLLSLCGPPHVAHISVTPHPEGFSNQDVGERGLVVCPCHGKGHTLKCVATRLMRDALRKDKQLIEVIQKGVRENKRVCIRASANIDGRALRVGDSQILPLTAMAFHIHASSQQIPLDFCSYKLEGIGHEPKLFHLGRGSNADTSIELLLQDGPEPRLSLKLSNKRLVESAPVRTRRIGKK